MRFTESAAERRIPRRSLLPLSVGPGDGDRAPDGRYLVVKPASDAREASVTVVLNWFRQVDGKKP